MSQAGRDDAGVLWTPPPDVRATTEIGRYLAWLERERGLTFDSYEGLQQWSVAELSAFWSSIWEFFEVKAHAPYSAVLASDEMPGAEWFPGARLNFAEHLIGSDEDLDTVAVIAQSQTREPAELTFRDLRAQIARARAGLERLGVGPGDRVVAYLPNIPETLVAFAATASLGAVWASCAPELGARSVVDRLTQLDPTVLLTVDGYGFRDRKIDRREEVATIRAALPTPPPRRACPVRRALAAGHRRLGGSAVRARAGSSSCRSRSTIRCSCSSRRARPAGRRRSSTATAASCSSCRKPTRSRGT